MCAALGAGIYDTKEDVCKTYEIERRFAPAKTDDWRMTTRQQWKLAVGRA